MRPILRIALVVALFVPLSVQATAPDLRITEILPDPAGGREFIEIHNAGNASVSLAGYTIHDAANNTYTFANRTLPAGARIVVWGGGSDDVLGPAWPKAAVWNNGGDTATLRDPHGAVVATMTYGTNPAAPAPGNSIEETHGVWREGTPTPGRAPGGGGTATATVQNVAPAVQWTPPSHARAGTNITVSFDVQDPNGDPVTWYLNDTAALASGSAGAHAVVVAVPATEQAWTLRLEANDGIHHVIHNHTVLVRASDLLVDVPAGGVAFGAFVPGARNVAAAPFYLENLAPHVLTPRIDVSDLVGPASIAVAGNLTIGMTAGNTTTWTPYAGPLTQLPPLPVGERAEVFLRLDAVPDVLPAGDYGTSFTVIA